MFFFIIIITEKKTYNFEELCGQKRKTYFELIYNLCYIETMCNQIFQQFCWV